MNVGSRLRQIRKSKGYTVKDVAELTNYSSSFISQVERNIASPSINSLKRICDALKIPIAYIFDDDKYHDYFDGIVVRKDHRRKLSNINSKTEMFLLSPNLKRKIELLLIKAQPGAKSGEYFHQHKGEECGMIITGTMTFEVGDKSFVLYEGDSAYFSSEIPHRWRNDGDTEAVFIWAITPPSF